MARKKDDFIYHIANGTMFGIWALGMNQYMLNQPWLPTVFIGVGISSAIYYLAKTKKEESFEIPKVLILLLIQGLF